MPSRDRRSELKPPRGSDVYNAIKPRDPFLPAPSLSSLAHLFVPFYQTIADLKTDDSVASHPKEASFSKSATARR
jgi:hypothetical protein